MPVIVVPKGNPGNIRSPGDLLQNGVRLSLADPKMAAIGKVVEGLLKKDDLWKHLWQKAVIHRETVNQVANDVKLTAADAGIVWDATAIQYPTLEIVRVDLFEHSKNEIAVGLITASNHPDAARRFAEVFDCARQRSGDFQEIRLRGRCGARAAMSNNRPKSDVPFCVGLGLLAGLYVVLIGAMLLAEIGLRVWGDFGRILADENIRYAIRLSLISSTISTILALWVAVPIAYVMSRTRFPGKNLLDGFLDIPLILPPLVVGLCLLILFRQTILRSIDDWFPIAFHIPAVILAQFTVAAAFSVRTLRATFDELSPRQEQVALTLGCSRAQAFWLVVLPEARSGLFDGRHTGLGPAHWVSSVRSLCSPARRGNERKCCPPAFIWNSASAMSRGPSPSRC